MKRSFAVCALGCAVVMLLAGCAHTSKHVMAQGASITPQQIEQAHNYYPLAVGMKWQYQVNRMGTPMTWTREILSETGDVFTDSDGAKLVKDSLGVKDQYRYFIRTGKNAGFAWWAQLSPTQRQDLKIVQMDVPVKTAQKTYDNCMVIDAVSGMPGGMVMVERSYYAPGVGMVKRLLLTRMPNGKSSVQEKAELVSFTKP